MWAGVGAVAYNAGVAYVGRTDEMLAPGYASPPDNPLVSGSSGLLPFADLGWEGRRYVTDVITPRLIENVMGERRWLNRFAPMSGSTASRDIGPVALSSRWPSWNEQQRSTDRPCSWSHPRAQGGLITP